MRLIEDRWLGGALGLALLAILELASGCRSATQSLAISGPGWHVQEGQALWRPRERMPELAGDLVLAGHADGRSVIAFAKTPMTLVQAQTTRTHWRVEFPPRRLRYDGRGPAPTRFIWLYLPAALAGEGLPAHLLFQRKPAGGWTLKNTRTGETVEGFLAP
jgi:hypothetical protein